MKTPADLWNLQDFGNPVVDIGHVATLIVLIVYTSPRDDSAKSVKTLLSHSVYRGKVRFIRANRGHTDTCCQVGCRICRRVSDKDEDVAARVAARVAAMPNDVSEAQDEMTKLLNHQLKMVTGDFLHIAGVITPSMCSVAPHGFSPTCHLGDGVMHLLLVPGISRRQNASLLLRMITGDRTVCTTPYVQLYRSTEFSFTPQCQATVGDSDLQEPPPTTAACFGTWNVDGEIMPQKNLTTYFK
ncbi:unnamed protein product [Soboliphyme baturini]|uniref:CERK_C domain-containing protein n=1 Tax=Soboliphyme baturini TaxID=241478 RepID=A0A183J0Q1_9BILA|nr:unnamed protein product [Soboliphyme baturini]